MNWNEYKEVIKQSLDSFVFDEEIPHVLRNSIANNQKIFVGGNGGSAAIANHIASDLSKGANKDWEENFKRYKAICLSSNIAYITAISNDKHYEDIFKQQLVNLAEPNDILMLISSSGNSPNVVRAVEYGNEIGMQTIGITGFGGGKLHELSQYTAHMNFPSYEVSEDIHAVFGHFLAQWLRDGENE